MKPALTYDVNDVFWWPLLSPSAFLLVFFGRHVGLFWIYNWICTERASCHEEIEKLSLERNDHQLCEEWEELVSSRSTADTVEDSPNIPSYQPPSFNFTKPPSGLAKRILVTTSDMIDIF